jgi:uncharacterized protein (DUF302 family)
MSDLGFQTKLNESYEAAIEKVTAALKVEGFGVLTSIDMKDTMKKKLDVDISKYVILGACNPQLANRALTACPEVGLLLPCNVIVYEEGEGTIVNIVDPSAMLELIKDDPEVEAVAREARERLARVAASLSSQ